MLIIQLIFNASQRLLPEGWNRRILSLFSDHFSNNKLNTLYIRYSPLFVGDNIPSRTFFQQRIWKSRFFVLTLHRYEEYRSDSFHPL